MKVMIVFALALVALAAAAPVEPEPPKILRSEDTREPDGTYNFGFETENGISRQESGQLKEVIDEENKPHTVVSVRGFYTYTDKEGKVQTVNYFADENGYHAEGDSIPKVPGPARR